MLQNYESSNVICVGDGVKAISEIAPNVDLTDYYNKTKTYELLVDKVDKTDPQSYVSLSIAQTINANKTFNSSCRFTSTIDGMSTITGASFVKSSTDNTIVLLGAGGTKSISGFGGSVDDSNYVKISSQEDKSLDKIETRQYATKYDIDSAFVKKISKNLQVIEGYLQKGIDAGDVSEDDDDYITGDEVANSYVTSNSPAAQQILDIKTFTENVNTVAFVKSGGTNQQILFTNGTMKPISEFSDGGGDMSNIVQKIGADLQVINGKLRNGEDVEEESDDDDYITRDEVLNRIISNYNLRKMGQNAQNITGRLLFTNSFRIEDDDSQELTDTTYLTRREINNVITSKFYNFCQVLTPPIMLSGFTASQSIDTIQASQGRAICTLNLPPLYTLFCPMNSDYLVMFTTDGYVHFTTQATVWSQNVNVFEMCSTYLDEALLDAAWLSDFPELYAYIRERYHKPVPPAQRIPFGEQTLQQQEKDSDDVLFSKYEVFVPPTSNGSDPQLIVYGDCVTLIVSYDTTGLFPNGYIFKNYPEEARPKAGDKVIALVGTDTTNKNKTFETQSHIYETQKKQTDMNATGLFGDNKVNYLNSDIKLQDELAIYKADRAAFFIKDGPFITFSFGAKLGQIIQSQANSENQQTVHRLFSTISQKLLPPNTKYMPILVESQEFSAMYLFKNIYDKSLAVEVAISGVLNKYDCEFQGTYILDNYKNPTSNEEPNALSTDPKEHDSHIDEVIIKHDGKLSSSQLTYTITNVFNQIKLIASFDQVGHVNNTYYIVDDGTCKICVFNQYFETKRQSINIQEIGRIPDVILPADCKSMGFPTSVYRNAGGYNIRLAGSTVVKGMSAGSSAMDTLFGPNKQQSKQQFSQDFKTF
ncbi:MAG: hypothetical protein EZS28_012445 [Streblomastix strix]|uniref:Uncharacterized protein n=1 Tax=Streblomastix strix TaxID=222440 RepID=A0A5J4WCD1_9EUKA|nr:MAG: hypothetical protein EZS28_012445 [Streblomastix strix]